MPKVTDAAGMSVPGSGLAGTYWSAVTESIGNAAAPAISVTSSAARARACRSPAIFLRMLIFISFAIMEGYRSCYNVRVRLASRDCTQEPSQQPLRFHAGSEEHRLVCSDANVSS